MSDSHQSPSHFLDLKRDLVSATTEERLTASWNDILNELGKRTAEIAQAGPNFVPQVNFADLDKLTPEEINVIKSKGVVVIHGIIDSEIASGWKRELDEFVKVNPPAGGNASMMIDSEIASGWKKDLDEFVKVNPQAGEILQGEKEAWDLCWTQPQVQARAHPNYLKAATWINNLFHVGSGKTLEGVDLSTPLVYGDGFRIRRPGSNWSYFPPHIDGGALERWEDKAFSTCYKDIFEGNWRQHDPFDVEHRVYANGPMHNQRRKVSVFRSFQGWMALNKIAPSQGTLRVFPDVKLSNAYLMLRPFFSPIVSPDSPDYLDAKNWKFDISASEFPSILPGGPGVYTGLMVTSEFHPHLRFDEAIVCIPKVQPGDMVFWHCDMIHTVDSIHNGTEDSSVLYIPALPKTPFNSEYVAEQAKLFLQGQNSPDTTRHPEGTKFVGMATQADIKDPFSRAAMLLPIEVA